MRGLSLVVASGGHSSSRCAGLSLSWPLLLRSTGSRRAGSVIVAHGPSCSAACGIFPDQTRVPCIGRQILNHCATREALHRFLPEGFLDHALPHLRHLPLHLSRGCDHPCWPFPVPALKFRAVFAFESSALNTGPGYRIDAL